MVPLFLRDSHPGVIVEDCITAEAAATLTGYNIQHIRRLIGSGKLDAIRVGRSWLIKVRSFETYLSEVVAEGDGRFGPRMPAKPNIQNNASG